MSRKIGIAIVSAALLVGWSGVVQADDAAHHRGQAAKPAAPAAEASLPKLPHQSILGMVVAKPQSNCNNIACASYAGVGF